jgi:flagella basal body P-ring formation protein FlgA
MDLSLNDQPQCVSTRLSAPIRTLTRCGSYLRMAPERALCLLLVSLACAELSAAEQITMRFRSAPTVESNIIRLRDLVEIVTGNVPSLEKLGDLPLGPAPREGVSQTWYSSDIFQHLELRGVHPNSIRWSGEQSTSLTRVERSDQAATAQLAPAYLDQRAIDIAQSNATAAIKDYLNLRSGNRTQWRIELQVPDQFAKMLQSRRNIASIGGGQEPWTGQQTFTLQIKSQGKLVPVELAAMIDLPPMVVVAAGPLRRDQLITAEMLKYAPLPNNADPRNYFTDIQQVLGQHLRRSASTNQALTEEVVGAPIVIQRSDLVEVESVAGAVVVRTSAKSLGAGAVGDVVDIELPNRKRVMATILGPGQVRLAAVSQTASNR